MTKYLIFGLPKGMRFDLTCQMGDVDRVVTEFRAHHVTFEKKYTTLYEDKPSTITFKGLKGEFEKSDLTELFSSLNTLAVQGYIGMVYVNVRGFAAKQNRERKNLVPEEKKSPSISSDDLTSFPWEGEGDPFEIPKIPVKSTESTDDDTL